MKEELPTLIYNYHSKETVKKNSFKVLYMFTLTINKKSKVNEKFYLPPFCLLK